MLKLALSAYLAAVMFAKRIQKLSAPIASETYLLERSQDYVLEA